MAKVWRMDQNNNMQLISEHKLPGSVNCIAWAPSEFGLSLAAGTSEGKICILSRTKDGSWEN
jgi:protein transport protein SEC13